MTPTTTKQRDHPRSRGEYPLGEGMGVAHMGSSPLSRGILQCRTVLLLRTWIIPALAGNTDSLEAEAREIRIIPALAGNTSANL